MNQHNQQSLKNASQDYFEQIHLTDDELNQLTAMFVNAKDSSPAKDTSFESSLSKRKSSESNSSKNSASKSLVSENTTENIAPKIFDAPMQTQQTQINPLAQNQVNNQPEHISKKIAWHWYGLVASVVIAFVVLWQFKPQTHGTQEEISYLIAKEVAKNHMHLKPLEVNSNNFSKVSGYFHKLDFKPLPSAFLAKDKVTNLLGARYCSIQSVTAAQIRYKNADDKIVTFYEVGYDAKKFGDLPNLDQQALAQIKPKIHYINGMKVKVWREKGLLMSSVVDAH